MDLWVVAAAAGAGYVAKYWQNFSSEKENCSESFTKNLIEEKPESHNLVQQTGDRTFPFRRLGRNHISREEFVDKGVASTSGSDVEALSNARKYREEEDSINGCSGLHYSGDMLITSFRRFHRNRSLRSRHPGYIVKPLNSMECCLTAQLYRDHAKMEEYVLSSIPSQSKPMVRPLLIMDGSRVISRASGEDMLQREKGVCLQETELFPGRGSVELPKRPRKSMGPWRFKKFSSSSMKESGRSSDSQGSANGMLLFFLGITIGIISTVIANKREVDKLNEMLKQTENLVQDLHEELEMKDSLTVKELTNEDNEFQNRNEHSFLNKNSNDFLTQRELDGSGRYDKKVLPNQKAEENFESMREIEAELEVELERLELNMKASSLNANSEFGELDPNFVAEVVRGDLRIDTVKGQPDSVREASGTATNQTHTPNYAVSPHELSLRLHELIQSRLEARIMELETQLQDQQNGANFRSNESQLLSSKREFSHCEIDSSSTEESPVFIDEGNESHEPLVMSLSGEALNAYNEAYEEMMKMTENNQENPDNGCDLHHEINEEMWPRSWGSNEVGESGEETEDEDDVMGKLLIKQIVEKTRQGSPALLNAQKLLYSMDRQQIV